MFFFDKPEIQVCFGLGDAVYPAHVGILPVGEAVGGFGNTVVIGVPDLGVFQTRHIENVGLGRTVGVDSGGVAGVLDRLAESDGIIGELLIADLVDAGIVFNLNLGIKNNGEGDLHFAFLYDIQTELRLLNGLFDGDGL